jgi:MFS superfamily sulfate permease-like transporter
MSTPISPAGSGGAPAPNAPTGGVLAKDIVAGFLVFLIALPLCLGIAMASGFPPIAGVITAVVGGLLGPLLGSARLTIKGPAAGLIVIVLGAVQELGAGDAVAGYRRALAVGVVAAGVQIVFAISGAAAIGAVMPPSVVHGMLAAIGVIIVSKQVHIMMGVLPHGKSPLDLLSEIPESLMHNNPEILLIGGVALVILLAWPKLVAGPLRNIALLQKIPGAMLVLAAALPLSFYFHLETQHGYSLAGHHFEVGPKSLLSLPDSLLSAVVFPDFSVITSLVSIKYIVMYALVGTIESVLSVLAVDALDPERKPSNLDRDVLSVGVGNLIASAIGGLPMISEIVRSKANIDAGATSGKANFFHALFLVVFIAAVPGVLQHLPLAALAAMLVFTGLRLAAPAEFKHVKAIGNDQLALFMTTLVVTLVEDLLVGVAAGVALKLVLHVVRGASIRDVFGAKIVSTMGGDVMHVRVQGAATFLTLLRLRPLFARLPAGTARVEVDLSDVRLVDHTFQARLLAMADEWAACELVLVGLDTLKPASSHPCATRRAAA